MSEVLPPYKPQPDWQHLKRYGYAPGDYMSRCICCGQVKGNLDKRAIMCRECAEKRYAEDSQAAERSE